jgi:hypothetical protein
MLLKNGDGIRCDKCNKSYTNDFTYYSYDARDVVVSSNYMPKLRYNNQPVFSFDICSGCMAEIEELVKKNYKPTPSEVHGKYPKGIYCDLSGKHLKGGYTFYHICIDKVKVFMSNTVATCDGCGAPSKDSDQCKCGGTSFSKTADTVVDNRHLELSVCGDVYESFVTYAKKIRTNPEASEWST